ncbi:MAG: type II secretion system F family protein [Planctomycetota bacterium]|nr:type II secretion system F family protein [Planctomycetota bacterium]
MPTFKYIARDDSGASVEGEVTAPSEIEAARELRGEGKFIVRIYDAGAESAPAKRRRAKKAGGASLIGDKFKPDDVIYFTNQLAVMLDTGVSLAEALDSCLHESNSPRFDRALRGVIEQVNGGSEFSAALAAYPRVFPIVYVNLVKASEASGTMGEMLLRLADFLEAQRDMAKKIKGALTYPIVMVVFAIGVTIFLMTYVLPKFTAIYAGKEDKLPVLTRFLMAFSESLVDYGPYALGVMVVGGIGMFFFLRKPSGRLWAEAVKLKLPVIGPLMHKTYLTRSLRTLGTMIHSGVSMLEGVQLTASACGSGQYERMWKVVYGRLETGQQLSESLADQDQIPKVVYKMLGAGERSGKLGLVMNRVANFSETELNNSIKTFTSMLEPAIVMFLGVVVGGLVLAVLLPIFTISKAMH